MHPFPPTKDLQFLMKGDAVLDCVSVMRFTVSFAFENDCAVQSISKVTYVDGEGVANRYAAEDGGVTPITFHRLLGKRLTSVTSDAYLLTLAFEGGCQLLVHSDDGPYEAGQIHSPATPLIVF